jgi:RNA polymerase sigma factor (sigma-70 family)
MAEAMRKVFLAYYGELRKRLRHRLGSEDLANDVLHETYLKVETMGEAVAVKSPTAYLFRMALNVAADRREVDGRFLGGDEVEELLQIADDSLNPARILEGRVQVEALQLALEELSPRRRDIVIAARIEEIPHREIAVRFGISVRMVEKELKAALEHCGRRLDREVIQRFGPQPRKPS